MWLKNIEGFLIDDPAIYDLKQRFTLMNKSSILNFLWARIPK
jgi:hypothetical protein